jgi:hypothetical protein
LVLEDMDGGPVNARKVYRRGQPWTRRRPDGGCHASRRRPGARITLQRGHIDLDLVAQEGINPQRRNRNSRPVSVTMMAAMVWEGAML